MADLSDRSADRAQLLIIAGVGLALLLVVMALALNTAVFGGVHVASTDDSVQEERAALEYQDAVERGVAGVFPALPETGDYDILSSALAREVANVTELTDRHYADDGVATRTTAEPLFESSVVHDNSEQVFENAQDESEWTVAEGVTNVSRYEMELDRNDLAHTSDCAARDECFNVTVTGDDGTWRMATWETGNKTVVQFQDDDSTDRCESEADPLHIDLANGSTEACEDDEFDTFTDVLTGPYNITYTSSDNASGTYNLTVDGVLDDADFHEDGGDSPFLGAELVGAEVTVEYRTANLHYRNEIRLMRGEDYG